jgi:hypothetical protein
MKNSSLSQLEVKAPEPAVSVVEYASAPMMARCESDGNIADVEMFPFP